MKALAITVLLVCCISFALGETIITSCGPTLEGMPSANWNVNTYSPFLCYRITGLTPGKYTLMVWNLETVTPLPALPDCAGPQNSLCGYTTTFDNTGVNFQETREIWVVNTVQNFGWAAFHIVARLWKGQIGPITGVGCEGMVEMCYEQWLPSTNNHPPVLQAIKDATVMQGNLLQIKVEATADAGVGGDLKFKVYPQIAGMTINKNTGLIQWRPTKQGQYNIVVSVFQGNKPTLYDSQVVNILVKKQVGLPTPKPKPAGLVVANLENIEKDIACRWYVTISLMNFQPGAISVIGRGSLAHCGSSNAPTNYYWSGPGLIKFVKNGDNFTFIQNDYGNYTYIFTDSKNQTASINFTVPMSGTLGNGTITTGTATGTHTTATSPAPSGTGATKTTQTQTGIGGTPKLSVKTSVAGGTGTIPKV